MKKFVIAAVTTLLTQNALAYHCNPTPVDDRVAEISLACQQLEWVDPVKGPLDHQVWLSLTNRRCDGFASKSAFSIGASAAIADARFTEAHGTPNMVIQMRDPLPAPYQNLTNRQLQNLALIDRGGIVTIDLLAGGTFDQKDTAPLAFNVELDGTHFIQHGAEHYPNTDYYGATVKVERLSKTGTRSKTYSKVLCTYKNEGITRVDYKKGTTVSLVLKR